MDSFYDVARNFFEAECPEDTAGYTEKECSYALKFLALDFSFSLRLERLGYRLVYESGRSVVFPSARSVLKYLAKVHRHSQCWLAQANDETVWRLAREMSLRFEGDSEQTEKYLDSAARELTSRFFADPTVRERALNHFCQETRSNVQAALNGNYTL